jgi:hypothetical protein
MATRSRIGIQNPDGSVNSIYCHFDGYPSHNGVILQDHYSDRDKLQQLIELGDISSLGDDLLTTRAYHRDRNEDYSPPTKNESLELFKKSDFEEYGYVYTLEDKWVIFRS